MAQGRIRWKRGDYISLGRAVSQFNQKINQLQQEEKKSYLPSTINYQETIQNITTRQELNRVIKSLRRFKQEGAEELYITKAGEQLTRWERRELGIQSRTAQRRLSSELAKLNKPDESGYSRAQMGSSKVKEIESRIKNIKDIEGKKGVSFETLKFRLQKYGASDYSMKRSITYRKNYLEVMEKYSHLDNYELLMNKLKSFSNPIDFYEFVSQNELSKDLTYQSDQNFSQQAFNSFIESLGIEIQVDSET